MNSLQYKFSSTLRIVSLTLAVIGLIALFVEGYIDNEFNALRFVQIGILIWFLIYFILMKPRPTETNNVTTQTPPETPGSQQNKI
jgi:hypothetical protein